MMAKYKVIGYSSDFRFGFSLYRKSNEVNSAVLRFDLARFLFLQKGTSMRRSNKLSLVFKLGHSPPFITFLIDTFNTGRTVIFEKSKESGANIKC